MKKSKDLILSYRESISFEELDNSLMKCKKGVMWKQTPLSFVLNEFREVYRLHEDLHNGSYAPYPSRMFPIYYPKFREILSIYFRDRVFQRSLNDNILYPTMVKTFTKSNCACQKGKGTDFALHMLLKYLRHHYRKYGLQGTVVQFDIHGYYKHMNCALPKRIFELNLSEKIASDVITKTLEQQYNPIRGFLPGSQMVQIAGISVLSSLDHYIKEHLKPEFYIRYMDDLLLIFLYKETANKSMNIIVNKLADLGFTPNPKKTRLFNLCAGIKFLGFHFKISNTGKVRQHVLSKNIGHRIHMINSLIRKIKKNEVSVRTLLDSYISWSGHISRSKNSHNLLILFNKKLLKAIRKL